MASTRQLSEILWSVAELAPKPPSDEPILQRTNCVVVKDKRLMYLHDGIYYILDLTKIGISFPNMRLHMSDVLQLSNLMAAVSSMTCVSGYDEVTASVLGNAVTFEFDGITVTLPQAPKTTLYDDALEIVLKPKLINTYEAEVYDELFREAAKCFEYFPAGQAVRFEFDPEAIYVSNGPITVRHETVSPHNFPSGWTFLTTISRLKRLANSVEDHGDPLILSGSANDKNSLSSLMIKDVVTGVAVVVAPMIDAPIS